MAAGDISIRFVAEGDQTLKSAIQAIDQQIKALNEGVKTSTEAMKGMSSEEEASAKKSDLLAKSIEANKEKLTLLGRQYEEAKQKLQQLAQQMEEAKKSGDPAAIDKATTAYNKQSAEVSKLEGAMNKAEGEIVKAQNAIDGLGDEMEETDKATEKLGDGFTVVKGVITNLISEAITKLISSLKDAASYMMEAGMSFESTMSEVEAISGATADEMVDLSNKAQEMGAKTKFSASQAGEAFTYMAMAGWKTKDMIDGIDGIMSLAAASGEDLASTSDIVTDALTAFGKSAGDAGKLADIMAAASSNANTNVHMMGETFKYAAPVAGALGYTMEDTALAIGLMANAGIKSSQAGTSLRSMMSNLAAPTAAAEVTMAEFGISLTNANGEMKPFNQVLEEMRNEFRNLDPTVQSYVAKTIAGKNAMSGFLAIINASDEDFDKLKTAIDNSSGSAEKMANTMQNNLAGSITILKSATEGVAITLYNAFAGTAKTAVDGLTQAVSMARDKIAEWVKTDKAQEMLKKIADAVQNLVNKFVSNLEPALDAVVSGINGIVNVATILITNWDKITKAVELAVKAFIAVKTAMAALQFAQLVASINPVGVAITALISIIALLITHWDDVKAGAKACWNDIKNAWSNAGQWFKNIVTTIQNAFNGIGDKISNLFKSGWEKVKSAWSTATSWFSSIASNIVNAFRNIPSSIGSFFSNAWNSVRSAWASATSHFSSLGSQIVQAIRSAISSLPSQAMGWARDMMHGFGNGITRFMSSVTQPIKNLASKIASFLHFSRPDEGPLRDYETWMPDFVKGLAKGITRSTPILATAAEGLASSLVSGMSGVTLGTNAAESNYQPIYMQVDGHTFARLMNGYIDEAQGQTWTNMAIGLG